MARQASIKSYGHGIVLRRRLVDRDDPSEGTYYALTWDGTDLGTGSYALLDAKAKKLVALLKKHQ